MEKTYKTVFDVVVIACFLTLGNFLYQWMTGQHLWAQAAERSFFQIGGALGVYFFYPRVFLND